MEDFVLTMSNISKSFAGNEVLHSVSFNLRAGETHALMGENGSGKSTLMKILMGIYQRDRGIIRLFGEERAFSNPAQALEHGIAMIHQELSPLLDMEIAENIFMGREIRGRSGLLVNIRETRRQAAELLAQFGLDLDPTAKMRALSVGQCQLVEIIKAISCNAKIIIMDEPTSAITEREAELLFEQIHRLRSQGVSIIYISHKMEEIFKIADRVTVLRDGNFIGVRNAAELDPGELITMMVGRELSDVFPKKNVPLGETVLRARNISLGNRVRRVGFELRRGEILGVAGLVGAGRSELVESIFGLRKKDGGEVELRGRPVSIRRPGDAIRQRVALITEDRKTTGLNLRASVGNNITIVSIRDLTTRGLLNRRKEQDCAAAFMEKLRIKAPGSGTQTLSLSGGNQQKVVIAKWLVGDPDIIIMDEPTRGIDVGAKRDIYLLMGDLVEKGKAIVMISSEMPELIGMCDRIIVLTEGRLTGEFDRGQFSQEAIMWRAAGGGPAASGGGEKGGGHDRQIGL
ncbi:MAG: sugar ABC transporter ATP-binding protein [Spirochaetaceae bacterium]|jgi:ABC-type sugar transport system ATPase subunit|nr:sugar ABC transporter ATP-binding protein [Spirochaetaceae bacterium]